MRKLIVSFVTTFVLVPAHFTAGASPPANNVAASESVANSSLQDKLLAFLQEKTTGWKGQLQARIDPPKIDHLSTCADYEIFMPGRGATLRPRVTLGIRCLQPQAWVSYTQASLRIKGTYYVTAQAIKAGTTLNMQDLVAREGDLLRLPRGTIIEPRHMVGYITRQRLNARKPVKASVLRSPESVERGQTVYMEVRGVGFVARSEGQAMQDGEPGDHIQVRTPSGQTVTATILNAHTVLIPM